MCLGRPRSLGSYPNSLDTGRRPLSLPANRHYPCLLGRQVDQFEELEESRQDAQQDPCRLVRRVNQFREQVRDLRSCQTSWQGAGADGLSFLACQTAVPATQGGRGETKNVGEDRAGRPHATTWFPDIVGEGVL